MPYSHIHIAILKHTCLYIYIRMCVCLCRNLYSNGPLHPISWRRHNMTAVILRSKLSTCLFKHSRQSRCLSLSDMQLYSIKHLHTAIIHQSCRHGAYIYPSLSVLHAKVYCLINEYVDMLKFNGQRKQRTLLLYAKWQTINFLNAI